MQKNQNIKNNNNSTTFFCIRFWPSFLAQKFQPKDEKKKICVK